MNGNSVLLDTVALIALLANERSLGTRLQAFDIAFAPSIALGELYFGAFKSEQVQTNLNKIRGLRAYTQILSCDEVTAQVYGQIRNRLTRIGRPIPGNDVWIAAIAIQNNLPLLTQDAHFQHVSGLNLETW